MRLEKKKDEEIAARQGMTGKTIIAVIWLGISAVGAYFLLQYMFGSGALSYATFYNLGIPKQIPRWVITAVMVLFIVIFMQSFLFLGFIIASPEGRRRTGDPTTYSRSKDPFNDHSGRG